MKRDNEKRNNKLKNFKLLTTAIVILLISSMFIYYFIYKSNEPEKINDNSGDIVEIDDRISPLENQGLILQILRIRHRGLSERLVKFGNSWKENPTFYFIANIDGKEFNSDGKTMYKWWDSMNQERKIIRDVGEEQETSDIKIAIVEKVPTGLFKRKTKDVEKDSFTVKYDYRTGRWTGLDDSYKDNDGTGHYVGETFEVWFNLYQTDIDGDGIPYWSEVNLIGSDPRVDDSNKDPDEDGCPTAWEWKWGYDPHIWDDHENLDPDVDGLENIEEYKMAKWLADPYHQDIYVEVDGMQQKGLFDVPHVFRKESQQFLIERFCKHGMCLYYDDGWPDGPINGGGEILPQYSGSSQDAGMILQYYKHNFADERKGVFKYLLVGSDSPAFNHPAEFNRADSMHIYSDLFLYLSMRAYTQRTRILYFATQAQHELGHSLGITPWSHEGCDNDSYMGGRVAQKKYVEDWGNYPSVMNYFFINQVTSGLFFKLYDYSDGSHGPGDQNDWEKLYLPTFQMEARVVEEYGFEFPPPDLNEQLKLEKDGWEFSSDLTDQFNHTIGDWSPVYPIQTDWYVLIKKDDSKDMKQRNIRVFAKPDVYPTVSTWTLSYEGNLDYQGNINFYSQAHLIDELMQRLIK